MLLNKKAPQNGAFGVIMGIDATSFRMPYFRRTKRTIIKTI